MAKTLKQLREEARGCQNCTLWANATQTVFGAGDPHARHAPFRFETAGSQIIFYDPETEYLTEERARENGSPRVFRDRGGLGS